MRLFLAAVGEDWELFFLFLTQTGLRISEAFGVNWEHLDLGREPRLLIREQLYEGKRQRPSPRAVAICRCPRASPIGSAFESGRNVKQAACLSSRARVPVPAYSDELSIGR
ncbi:MAG: hypothetical protein QM729_16475 [Solirubrobacterales bacterium]